VLWYGPAMGEAVREFLMPASRTQSLPWTWSMRMVKTDCSMLALPGFWHGRAEEGSRGGRDQGKTCAIERQQQGSLFESTRVMRAYCLHSSCGPLRATNI
jgi:hypothetical protein